MEQNGSRSAVARALEGVVVGAPIEYRGMSMTPLLGDDAPAGEYLTLDDALGAGVAEITEVSREGSVPELRVKNGATAPVLIIDGEELVGAKQNRVINLSVLAGAQRETVIPVSCVEAGRWTHATRQFSSSSRAHFASGRAAKVAEVSASLATSGTRRSNQGAVWAAIAAKASRMEAASDTGAMNVIFERHQSAVDEYIARLPAMAGQRGAVFAVRGRVVGAELFDRAAAWRRLMPKLVASYAIDAMDEEAPRPDAGFSGAHEFLSAVATAPSRTFSGVGEGTDVRLEGDTVHGAALVRDDVLVHLAAFARV